MTHEELEREIAQIFPSDETTVPYLSTGGDFNYTRAGGWGTGHIDEHGCVRIDS
jgi:hypothetical protein